MGGGDLAGLSCAIELSERADCDLYPGLQVGVVVAHISGIPVEEILLMAIPVAGAAYAGIMASLRVHRRRLLKRK